MVRKLKKWRCSVFHDSKWSLYQEGEALVCQTCIMVYFPQKTA